MEEQRRAAARDLGSVPEALAPKAAQVPDTGCVGYGEMSQIGIEIETSEGVTWVLPYSEFGPWKFCRGRDNSTDTVIWIVGPMKIFIAGRGLRKLLEPARVQRIKYLRPLPPAAGRRVPAGVADDAPIITKLVVIKAAKSDPDPEPIHWDGQYPSKGKAKPEDDGASATMNEDGSIEPDEVETE